MSDGQSVLRIANAASEDRIDVHLKFGVLGQEFELLIQNSQALLRNIVGLDIVDADLQIFEPGAIQALDAVGNEQIPIGDHPGDDSILPDSGDDGVELGMQQRLTAADSDDGSAHLAETIDAAKHFLGGDGLREIVEFIAIRAGKIAATNRNDMSEQRVAGGEKSFGDHARFTQLAMGRERSSANFLLEGHAIWEGERIWRLSPTIIMP